MIVSREASVSWGRGGGSEGEGKESEGGGEVERRGGEGVREVERRGGEGRERETDAL